MTQQNSASATRRQELLEAYEARTDLLLSGLALVYLVTYSAQMIAYDPQATWYRWASVFGNLLWLLFALDLLFRLSLSPHRLHFLRTHVVDVVTVVVPQLRALRALRAFTSDGILSKKGGAISGKAVASAALATALIVWVGSLMVLSAERGAAGAEITSFGDAIWWAFETVTTVGYGDFVPVTWAGRAIATLVMVVGISVLGVVSAGLAATLVKQGGRSPAPAPSTPAPTTPAPFTPADEVLKELAELKQMVAALQSQLAGSGGGSA